eukprot:g81613.t1
MGGVYGGPGGSGAAIGNELGAATVPGVTTGLMGVAEGGASVSFDQNQLNSLLQAFAAGGGAARQVCDYNGCVVETVGCHDYCTNHTDFSTAERIENEISMWPPTSRMEQVLTAVLDNVEESQEGSPH